MLTFLEICDIIYTKRGNALLYGLVYPLSLLLGNKNKGAII